MFGFRVLVGLLIDHDAFEHAAVLLQQSELSSLKSEVLCLSDVANESENETESWVLEGPATAFIFSDVFKFALDESWQVNLIQVAFDVVRL